MGLSQILETLVERVPGAKAAILADWEGEAVVAYTSGEDTDYEIKFVGAHHGIILNRAREMIERLAMGEAREITFSLERFHVITTPVNRDYYLVLTLGPGALPARAKPEVQKAVKDIEKDIG
jgi:predicted regulator of Ras-like GTPase activity (Roadblock/LC7/MglB family)